MEVRPQEDKLRAGWEGQEGGEWMVSEQGWQQFGWETESLTSTQQSFSVILLRH